jgi:hypothetical protein
MHLELVGQRLDLQELRRLGVSVDHGDFAAVGEQSTMDLRDRRRRERLGVDARSGS